LHRCQSSQNQCHQGKADRCHCWHWSELQFSSVHGETAAGIGDKNDVALIQIKGGIDGSRETVIVAIEAA